MMRSGTPSGNDGNYKALGAPPSEVEFSDMTSALKKNSDSMEGTDDIGITIQESGLCLWYLQS